MDDIKELHAVGWEIGNHTYSHRILSSLSEEDVAEEIETNSVFWKKHGIDLIPWLAYPNGRVADVGEAAERFLAQNCSYQGIFCNGGINLVRSRTEWLRFFPGNVSGTEMIERLMVEVERSKHAIEASMSA